MDTQSNDPVSLLITQVTLQQKNKADLLQKIEALTSEEKKLLESYTIVDESILKLQKEIKDFKINLPKQRSKIIQLEEGLKQQQVAYTYDHLRI